MIFYSNSTSFVLRLFIVQIILLSQLNIGYVQADTMNFTNIELSHDNNWPQHVEPTMAIGSDGTIFVGYKNAQTDNGGGYQVSFTYSVDGGQTWKDAVDMPDSWEGARQSDPWMVMYEESLYYLYMEFSFAFESTVEANQLTMASTSNKGQSWDFSKASYNTGFADKETFDIDANGNIFIVYDNVLGPADIIGDPVDMRVSRSFDGGHTYFENVSLQAYISPNYLAPYIISGQETGNLYATWSGFTFDTEGNLINGLVDVFFASSSDSGETWTVGLDINADYIGDISAYGQSSPSRTTIPVLEQDSNGRLYILWAEISEPDGLYNIWMVYSDNKGSSWSNAIQVNEEIEMAGQWMPDIEIDANDEVHLAYYEDYQNELYVKYLKFNPLTEAFSTALLVNNELTASSFTRPGDYLSLRVDSNNLPHLVWSDARYGEMDIYYGSLIKEKTSTKDNTSFSIAIIGLITFLGLRRRMKY